MTWLTYLGLGALALQILSFGGVLALFIWWRYDDRRVVRRRLREIRETALLERMLALPDRTAR